MTESKRKRALDAIYAEFPHVECKGLCFESCTAVPVMTYEREQLERVAGRRLPSSPLPQDGATMLGVNVTDRCPLLVAKRCSVHADRPAICRAFGVSEGLRCPHGCEPTRVLSDADTFDIFERVRRLR